MFLRPFSEQYKILCKTQYEQRVKKKYAGFSFFSISIKKKKKTIALNMIVRYGN